MPYLVGLDATEAADVTRVGGKGAALAAMARQGLAIPPTLCLTTEAYEVFVNEASLRPVITQELGRKSFADMRWEEIWDAALRIRNRFLRAPIPGEISAELLDRVLDEFDSDVMVVRSSAPGEDAAGASFAGLHDSYVGVSGGDGLLEAVRSVWASLWTDRALLYRRELGIDPDSSSMGVVIQRLVSGTVSGIAFGQHPTNPALVAVEAVHGLNQGLVDGTIEPDRWEVERDSGRIVRHVPPQARRRLVLEGGGTRVEEVVDEGPPLGEAELGRVVEATRSSGAIFGSPQDVEWTISGGRLVLLQSRPVTTGSTDEGDRRAWYLSLTRSLDTLRGLRRRVEDEFLPAMDREADEISARDVTGLDEEDLAAEIEHRRAAHDRWVEVYWREFIPLAHGIRLFGQFYNDVVRPEDPHEFMNLLSATPMLSLRRNRALAEMASMVRNDRELRAELEGDRVGPPDFAERLEAFLTEFGAAVYSDRTCFDDRRRVIELLLTMADAPPAVERAGGEDVETLTSAFLAAVDAERRPLAEEILDIGRASYRLRDDDNIHLARLEALLLEAVEEGRGRLGGQPSPGGRMPSPDQVVQALRHPNLVAEPPPTPKPLAAEEGFRARPRQLVGQPAGPGVAVGAARVVEHVDDLFDFEPGEVLVCDAIDPNMTFIVPMAGAVVERRGGMLIHGAIIAREYGLPCVTGVPDATAQINNGDRLTVDGYLGIVTVSRES